MAKKNNSNLDIYFLPYDVYERHRKVASFIVQEHEVLDVGGALDHLSQFVKTKKLIVANLEGGENADLIIKKGKLPFGENSFDTICAIDVLEHLPGTKRKAFVDDLYRVAKKTVILSFPIGTPSHNLHEKRMLTWLKSKNLEVKYLEEHIEYKLPTPQQLENITKNKKSKLHYSGNLKINEGLFKLYMFDPKIKLARSAVYYLKMVFNLLSNNILYAILSEKKFSQNVNRAYLIVEK